MFENESRSWNGKWIWSEDNGNEANTYRYFRKQFELESVAGAFLLHLTASTKYRLFINGSYVGMGPVLSHSFNYYYDTRDIGQWLKAGTNVLAVEVHHSGRFSDSRGGLLAELTANNDCIVQSDSKWKVLRANAWASNSQTISCNGPVGYQEVFDSRKEPKGWKLEGFDDSAWRDASVIRTPGSTIKNTRAYDTPPGVLPWTRLQQRDIPYMEERFVHPVDVLGVEESLDLHYNANVIDVSDQLSKDVMKPLEFSLVENERRLVQPGTGPALVRNSTLHLEEEWFDGVYNPCIVLDFGKVITGHVDLDVEGPAGGMIDIGYTERLADGRFVNAVDEARFADRLILNGGKQSFRAFYWKGYRYIKLKFRDCFEPVRLHAVQSCISRYPYEYKGAFRSNDELLNRTWEISRYTLELCSNDSIVDTPWREQGQWLGDASAVTLGGIYAAFGETRLVSKYLRQSMFAQLPTGLMNNKTNSGGGNWQGAIPDFSLWWVQAVWNHYQYTGEDQWIHLLYPHVCRVVQFFEGTIGEKGLVEHVPLWVFIDWAAVDKNGAGSALNALYYGTLEYASKMAEFKQDRYMAEYCGQRRVKLREAFQRYFWDEERQVFVDGYSNGSQSGNVSEHANALALLYQLADGKQTSHIIRNVFEERSIRAVEAQPFFTFQVLQALEAAGRLDLCLSIIRTRWNRMLSRGATSTWEEWGMNGSWRSGDQFFPRWRSLSHAWSAGPLEFLSKKLIGLEVVEPGFAKIRLNPVNGGLEQYTIDYPAPQGNIHVELKDGQFSIRLPEGIELVK